MCTGEVDQFAGRLEGLDYPRFIGHEVTGIVAAVGTGVDEYVEGDRVTAYLEGRGYAEYVVAPAKWLVPIGECTAADLALGEPIACSVNGVRKARPEMGDSVCIVGCGFMGLIMLQVFGARGVGELIALDRRESMLDLARRLGATQVVNPDTSDAVGFVRDLTNGRGVDIGVEAAGLQATLDLTARLVRMEGKLEVFGFHVGGPRTVDWAFWNWMAFEVVNGHTRSQDVYVEGMRQGIGLLESGALNMEPLVTHRFDLAEINEGFRIAEAKPDGFVKGVVLFGDV
jgi:threonine dehydrogenase-like Zn-dependent dehydrogenase